MEGRQLRGGFRGRARGGASGGAGGGATRGTRGGRPSGLGHRGVTRGRGRGGGSAGLGAQRPSVDSVSTRTLESLVEVQAIERPLYQKKRRDVPASRLPPDGCQSMWSSLEDIIMPTSSAEEGPSCSAPPSPAMYVECSTAAVNSGHSTPRSIAEKRPANADSTTPEGRKRRLVSSIAEPSSSNHPLSDADIAHLVNFGSEDETSDDDDEDLMVQPALVPRATRIFMPDEDEAVPTSNVQFCYDWPPSSVLQPEPSAEPEPEPSATRDSQPSAEYEPTTKFDFRWRGFSPAQTRAEARREPFSDINSGPTATFASPYEAFTAIWDRQIMEVIAVETNRYAQQVVTGMLHQGTLTPSSRITKWRDTDVDELYVFFSIILATGIIGKSRIETYWNVDRSILSSPGFAATMSFNRFLLLGKCLHFSNNDDCNPNEMTRLEAKLFKIRPVVSHLNEKFSQLYRLSRNIALDESLTQWKGWLDFKQFIKNKAAGVGIKTYEICESQTGYLWRFDVHVGHEQSPQDGPLSGTVSALVLKILNGLEHKGHTVWMDNFYNSPALARELKVRGFDCVGTLRSNRQFVPMELANLKKKDLEVGQMRGCTSGDVDLMVWRDKNLVALISTYHGMTAVKCGNVLKPSIVADYNVCMGGVDRKDQMLAMYPIERQRTRIWYKKFFKRLLNASVLNAYILLRTQQSITHRRFRESLVKELIARHTPPSPSAASEPSVQHFPAQYDFLAGKLHERQRRYCVVCNKRTNAYCKACKVPLCVFTCFEPHHTRQ